MEWRCKVEPPRLYRCLFGESRAIEYRVGSPRYSYCLLGVLSRKSLRRRAHSPHAISAVKRRQASVLGVIRHANHSKFRTRSPRSRQVIEQMALLPPQAIQLLNKLQQKGWIWLDDRGPLETLPHVPGKNVDVRQLEWRCKVIGCNIAQVEYGVAGASSDETMGSILWSVSVVRLQRIAELGPGANQRTTQTIGIFQSTAEAGHALPGSRDLCCSRQLAGGAFQGCDRRHIRKAATGG